MNDGKRQVTDETEPDENPIATIYYENGTELTGKAVTLQDGTVGVRIPGEFFKTALLPDGSMPDGVISVDIGPKHVEGGLPLTDDMVCMAVTAMLRDAVTYKLREPSLMREYEATKDLVATHVAGLLPGLDLAGQWSLDIMRDGDDYWLIDMAPAERSTFYEQAVPKGKRRPMMENWIPELGGKH